MAAICQAVQEGAASVDPFEFYCQGAGAFPGIQRPRTLWLGVTEGLDGFRTLHAAVDAALAKRRFPKDRQLFRPHLTIGRVRSSRARRCGNCRMPCVPIRISMAVRPTRG